MKEGQVRSQFRISENAYDWLVARAAAEHRSINGQLNAELEARMKSVEREKAA